MGRPLIYRAAAVLALGLASAVSGHAEEQAARVDWGQRHTVSAPLAGVVSAVNVRPGDRVDTGQVLFELDTRRLQADMRAAAAERERLRLELAEADREVERAEELYDRTLIAVRELELSRIQRAIAAAQLARADAETNRTRVDIDDSRIRALAPARVLSVNVSVGEAVSPALTPPVLATLGQTDPMRAETTVDATTAASLQPGQPVWVLIAGATFDGTVATIGWEPEDIGFGSGYRVGIDFSPPDSVELRAGQEAQVRWTAPDRAP